MIPAVGRILDIGCAGGDFLSYFEGRERVGVEPNRHAAEIARGRGLEVVSEIGLTSGSFAVVTMLDVLPLVPQPNELLRSIRDRLDDDGFLFIDFPGPLFQRIKNTGLVPLLRGRGRSSLNPLDFVFFPSERTMKQLFLQNGFELTKTVDIEPNRHGSEKQQATQALCFKVVRGISRGTGGRVRLASRICFVARPV